MKKSILLTLTLIISYYSMAQNDTIKLPYSGRFVTALTSELVAPSSKLLANGFLDNGDKLRFYDHKNTREVLRLNAKGDTLEINIPSVKFIKIDGFIYEIKRYTNISIEKVKPNWSTVLSDLSKKIDTINYNNHKK